MVTQSTRVSGHSSSHGSSLLDRQGDQRTRTWRPYEWFGWEYGYLGHIFWTPLFEQQFILNKTMTRIYITHLWNSAGQLSNENKKLMGEWKEITGASTINFKYPTWMSTSLLCSKAYRITNAKACVFSDSVLCAGKNGRWSCCDLEEQHLNGIRRTITSRIWIESTVCRRSSSGKYSQESQRWASSRRFKV